MNPQIQIEGNAMKEYHRISIPFEHEVVIYLNDAHNAKPYYWVIKAEGMVLLDSRHFNLHYEEIFLAVGDALDFVRSQSYGRCNTDYPPDIHVAFIDYCNDLQELKSLFPPVIAGKTN